MGFDAQDKEIVRLLTKLKEADAKYPPDLFASRRQSYLKHMGEVSLGIGAGLKIKSVLNGAKAPTLSSATSTVLESALVVAIVAETGTVAYVYRDKLAGFVKNVAKEVHVQEVASSPVPVAEEVQGVSPSQAVASTMPSVSLSESPTQPEMTGTPIPEVVDANTMAAQSTSVPNVNNGNNGNHYGQTPKPERTKEPENNKSKTSKPPKNNPKATKAK